MADVFFIGLSLSSILLLVALGLAITYGTMGVINMAHGELVMIGAYVTVLCQTHFGLHFLLCIPVAFVVTGAFGYAIERFVVRRLYGRLLDRCSRHGGLRSSSAANPLEFGAGLPGCTIDVWGRVCKYVPVPSFFRETFLVGDFVVQPYRSFIIVLTIGLFVLTWWLIFHTSFGMQLRAVSRNRGIASCCGIDDKKINAWTFAYGSALAGAAGVMLAGFKTVSPSMGTPFVIDGFLVVVMGGVGSLFGTLGSAIILGEVQGWVASLLNDVLARAIVFGVIIVVIILRPQGLFSRRGR